MDADALRQDVLTAFEFAHNRDDWVRPLADALAGVTARGALWRPGPSRKGMWDIVLQVAAWTENWVDRMRTGRHCRPREGAWPPSPETADEAAWEAAKQRLWSALAALRGEIEATPPAALVDRSISLPGAAVQKLEPADRGAKPPHPQRLPHRADCEAARAARNGRAMRSARHATVRRRVRCAQAACLLLLAALAARGSLRYAIQQRTVLKSESFDRDPGWEGFNNRIVPTKAAAVSQDFGYSRTAIAGKQLGEIGGRIQRAGKPAYYADRIAAKTLDDHLSASGVFALTQTGGNSGVFFGWFRAAQPDSGGRPMSSLGLQIHGERGGAGLAVRLISATNRSCGTFVTPFLPGKFRPTPLRADGTRYAWTLRYDPDANGGKGQFRFTIQSQGAGPEPLDAKNLPAELPDAYRKEALAHFPHVTTFAVDVPEQVRRAGATFDHFGMMNFTKAGGPITIYFSDLQYDGKTANLTREPGWDATGNRTTYTDHEQVGAHDYGYSAATSFAGGKPGELGGLLWRGGAYSYYADRVGALTLDDRLEASGKVVLESGAPDSDIYLGWFNSTNKKEPPTRAGHFLGIHVGGPTRVGHYFQPWLTTATGTRLQAKSGPVLTPGKVYRWALVYDPAAGGGNGAIAVTLGAETVALPLKPGLRGQGARFDRFGLFTPAVGGQAVRIYFDDLSYTAAGPQR